MSASIFPRPPLLVTDGHEFRRVTAAAANAVRARLAEARGRSTVEARLTEEDYEELKNWLASPRLRDALDAPSRAEGYAAALLLYCLYAEHIRRHGRNGELWCEIAPLWDKAPPLLRAEWMNDHGHPTARHRGLLEAGARTLGLRHAFGDDSTQEWYTSVFLQLGFTRRSFRAKLPELLCGYTRFDAAERLRTPGGANYAASFAALMDGLLAWRRKNRTREAMLALLKSSPWVLPEWHGELLEAALKKPELQSRVEGEGREIEDGDDAAGLAFLEEPTLRVPPEGEPEFRLEFTGLRDLPYKEACYTVTRDGRELTKLVRQPDGSYASTRGDHLSFPWWCHEVRLVLTGDDGAPLEERTFVCRNPHEWVEAFHTGTGRRHPDAHRLAGLGEVHLIYGADLTAQPTPARCFAKGDWRLAAHVSTGSDATLRFPEESEPYWSAREARAQPPAAARDFAPLFRAEVHVDAKRGAPTLQLSAHGLPKGVKLRRATLDKKPLDAAALAAGEVLTLALEPDRLARTLRLDLRVSRDGVSFPFATSLSPSAKDAYLLRSRGDRHRLGTKSVLRLNEVRGTRFEYRHVGACDIPAAHRVIEESRRRICGVPPKPFRLPAGMSGLGEPLDIYASAFNCEKPLFRIAERVLDTGVLGKLTLAPTETEGARTFRVTLEHGRTELNPKVRWCALVSAENRAPDIIGLSPAPVMTDEGFQGMMPDGVACHAIAVFYDDVCLGAVWNESQDTGLTAVYAHVTDADGAGRLAAALRVLKAPIRTPWMEKDTLRFLARHANTVMPLWITRARPYAFAAGNLSPAEPESRPWRMAAAALYRNAELPMDLELASRVLPDALISGPDFRRLPETLRELADLSPSFVAEPVRLRLGAGGCKDLAGMIRQSEDDLRAAAALLPQSPDLEFIKRTLAPLATGSAVTSARDRANLRTLLSLDTPVFRFYAATLILNRVARR